MSAQTLSRSRGSKAEAPAPAVESQVDLVQADNALLSLRASGHDYCSAIGEVFDNSIQAKANTINLKLFTDKRVIGSNTKRTEVVDRLAIGDDGDGMDAGVLHRSLQLGYSSRYDDRTGMGRFGVGAKLAGISVARRIELWSRKSKKDPWLYTYIDLDEIKTGDMRFIPVPVAKDLPDDCRDLVGDHGTLVVWSKGDRLAIRETGGARQANTVEPELMHYTAQTFRKFLDAGIRITISGKTVMPHDPLFLMTTTYFHGGDNPDPVATLAVDESFEWPVPRDVSRTAKVSVKMTVLPEAFRRRRGDGGSKAAAERHIPDNHGISILRADREIFCGTLKGVQPSTEKQDLDRFWGCEISFSPELDECFQVRNVKKGAEPTNGLRDKLRDIIYKTVLTLRNQIKSHWDKNEAAEQQESGVHKEAEEVAAKTEDRSPKPRAGHTVPAAERDKKIKEAAETLSKDNPDRKDEVEEQIRKRPFTLLAEGWPGSEIFEIDHLGSNALVKLNMRHPFYQQVYRPLVDRIDATQNGNVSEEERSLARLAQVGLDLLILAYARAEGMRSDATEHYADLRTSWGLHLKNMVQEWKNS
jgi:hypothetical protein